jgi:predicted TPR repeat methyltransferase
MKTSEKAPVSLGSGAGVKNDAMDSVRFQDNFEDPDNYELVMKRIHEDAETDPALSDVLKSAYLDADRDAVFDRYLNNGVPRAISSLIERFGIRQGDEICDYGCGPGQLGWALSMLGYSHVSLMDPNKNYSTGTGYVSSIANKNLEIINDFGTWSNHGHRYDAVVSKGTIHHWQHIPVTALGVRKAMKPGGLWFVTSEFFAKDPMGLVASLDNHPFYYRYNTYEWPYPVSVYVDLLQSVGFSLISVIPMYYQNNAYVDFNREPPEGFNVERLNQEVDSNLASTNGTVEKFWEEVDTFRREGVIGPSVYTHPQVMVFKRTAV